MTTFTIGLEEKISSRVPTPKSQDEYDSLKHRYYHRRRDAVLFRPVLQYLIRPVLIATLFITSGPAFADKDQIERLSQTKITLQQAIELAVAHHGGLAYEAELEDDSFTVEYEVKIVKDGKRFKVTVDGENGEIKRIRERK